MIKNCVICIQSFTAKKASVRYCSIKCQTEGRHGITGQKFGNLIALNQSTRRNKQGSVYWVFRCDCGNRIEKLGSSVSRNLTVLHCGCIVPEKPLPVRVEKECLTCFKACLVTKDRAKTFKYCSKDCMKIGRRDRHIVKCLKCGENFEAVQGTNRKYCSRACLFARNTKGV